MENNGEVPVSIHIVNSSVVEPLFSEWILTFEVFLHLLFIC